jgi:hypothetical protein
LRVRREPFLFDWQGLFNFQHELFLCRNQFTSIFISSRI